MFPSKFAINADFKHLSVEMEFSMSTLCPNHTASLLAVGLSPHLLCIDFIDLSRLTDS